MAEETVQEKIVVKIGAAFGTPSEIGFSLLIGKDKVDGKVVAAKYAAHVPYPDMSKLTDAAVVRFFQEGFKAVISNRFAAICRSSNDYGTPAEVQGLVDKYSTIEGAESALVREKKAAVEKLDDAATLAIKMLVNAQAKRVEGEVSKEHRAEFKKVALGWKAENNRNWVAALKQAERAVSLEIV